MPDLLLRSHKENEEVVENFSMVIAELGEYGTKFRYWFQALLLILAKSREFIAISAEFLKVQLISICYSFLPESKIMKAVFPFSEDVRDELRSKKLQDVLNEAKIKFTSNGVSILY